MRWRWLISSASKTAAQCNCRESWATAVNNRPWPIPTIVAGIALLLGGPLLASLAPTQSYWTNADQAQYQKAAADFHASTFQLPQHTSAKNTPPAYDPLAAKTRYEAAKVAYDTQHARLRAARTRPAWLAWILRLSGILLTALGLYGHFTASQSPSPAFQKSSAPISGRPTRSDTLRAPPSRPPGFNELTTIDGPPPKIDD
jgi:hypothetical protein